MEAGTRQGPECDVAILKDDRTDNVTALHPGSRLASKVKQMAFGTESFVGKASVEIKATDSQTGELLEAMIDRRGGGKYFWKPFHR